MNKRPLAPRFLNKLDNSLLLNRPDTWSTRFHLVFYYSLLFMIAFAAICFVVPMDHRDKSFFELWSGSAGVLALCGFITWLVYLLRFNVFKQYGTVFPGDRIKTFILYFTMIAMMSCVIYIPPVVECIRADNAYSSVEMGTDINRINALVIILERENIPDVWKPDTLIKYDPHYQQATVTYQEGREYLDSNDFRSRTNSADSIRWIRNDLAITYTFYDLNFVNDYSIQANSNIKTKSNKQLYDEFYKFPGATPPGARLELQNLVKKYSSDDYNDDYYYYPDNQYDLINSFRQKYHLQEASSGLHNISNRKYRLQEADYDEIIRATYYFALVLSLMVFVYRHSTIKTFFLSLLVGVILSILSGLFVAVLNLQEGGILYLLLFYFTAFVVVSMLAFISKKRSLAIGISLNAFVMMVAFIPLILVAIYYFHSSPALEYYDGTYYDTAYYLQKKQNLLFAEFAGGIILLILIETLFKRLYRAWYASPED